MSEDVLINLSKYSFSSKNWTPLSSASNKGYIKLVELLIEYKAQIDMKGYGISLNLLLFDSF